MRVGQKLWGDNLKVVWAEFSSVALADFIMTVIAWNIDKHTQTSS
jgi:hypothetical protein